MIADTNTCLYMFCDGSDTYVCSYLTYINWGVYFGNEMLADVSKAHIL